ncbi:MAG: zinc finger domain-containing protein [Nocardioidaceae bacterium]
MTTLPQGSLSIVCAGCRDPLEIDPHARTVRSSAGGQKSLTYADEALLVFDCPSCGHADAEDLVGD